MLAMYQNKLQLPMINTDEHYSTFGDINYSNEINSKHTHVFIRHVENTVNQSYRQQWFRCALILQTKPVMSVTMHSSY